MKNVLLVLFCLAKTPAIAQSPAQQYQQTQSQLAKGWNTWNTQSVLSHVLLPEGLSLNIGFITNGITGNRYMHESYLSTKAQRPEQIEAGHHAYDGSYTQCTVAWEGMTAKVETAAKGKDLVVLVTPLNTSPTLPPSVVIEVAMLWNRTGNVELSGNEILAKVENKTFKITSSVNPVSDFLPLKGRYLTFEFTQPIGISVGKSRDLAAITTLISEKRTAFEVTLNKYGANKETYLAQQSALSWNMIMTLNVSLLLRP